MSSLRLYAETPRAGQYGHRFLVPKGVSVSESEVVAAFSSTKEGVSFGQDHIAVGRKVKQLSLGGTTRDGLEVIVLTGLNAATLPDCLFNQLVEVLRRHSLSLESLVLTGIDWSKVIQDAIIIPSSDMRDWLSELDRVASSEANWSAKSTFRASANSGLKRNGYTDRTSQPAQRTALLGGLMLFFGSFLGVTVGWIAKDVAKASFTGTPKVVEHSEFASQRNLPSDSEIGATDKRADSNSNAAHLQEMFRKAIQDPGSSCFINLISAWPNGVKFPDSSAVYESLLDRCKASLDESKFDEVLMLLNAISVREREFFRESHFEVAFLELREKAIEGVNGFRSKDQKAYEAIKSESGRKAIDAARDYLKSEDTRTMRVAVEQWLSWAESPVVLEIAAIDLPTKGPHRFLFEFGNKTAGIVIDNADSVSASTPLSISLSSIGMSMYTLPCECTLYAEHQPNSAIKTKGLSSAIARFSGAPERLAGSLSLDESLGKQSKVVELCSNDGFASSDAKLIVRMAKQEHKPRLPQWAGGTNE
jgi:hypothetical protein